MALCIAAAFVASGSAACTLITDIDREKIPQPTTPVFPEVDAGPQPTEPGPDAGTPPDASLPPEEPADAGGDAGVDVGDAGAAEPDAALDAG